jgi:hypothetical protein
VICNELQAVAVRAERILITFGHLLARSVQIVLIERIEHRDRGGAHLTARGEDFVEGRVEIPFTARIRPVEELLPLGERVPFPEHEVSDHERLDVGQVPEHPQRVAATVRGREDYAMLSHLLHAQENAIPALPQILAYEVYRAQRSSLPPMRRHAGMYGGVVESRVLGEGGATRRCSQGTAQRNRLPSE